MKVKQSRKRQLTILAAAVALALGGSLAIALPDASKAAQTTAPVATQLQHGPRSFSALVERVKPAVVNISTKGGSRIAQAPEHDFKLPHSPEGSPFGEMFRHFFDRLPEKPFGDDGSLEQRAAGSGFIISADGYVVTSDHVIRHVDQIEVVLDDGTRYPAQVKGRDPKTDLALLKIEADRALPFVQLGDSDAARVGEWVVAVGNPFGLGGTVTAGILSARGRDIQSGPYDDYLQIDAPINRGNSGGPLFDASGQVIGINTAIYSPTGGSVGIGFAVPSSTAKGVIEQLQAEGRIERAWIGVQIQPVTQAVVDSLELPDRQGALVASVVPDSPAERAGIQPGDVIVKMDGEPMVDFKDLPKTVAAAKAGSQASFEVWRNGKARTLDVKLGTMPGEEPKLASSLPQAPDGSARLGIQLAELTPQARQRLGIGDHGQGVLVVDVERDSPASRAGIRSGSVIERVGQTAVSSPDEVIAEVQQAAEKRLSSVLLLVAYEGEKRFVAVRLAAA